MEISKIKSNIKTSILSIALMFSISTNAQMRTEYHFFNELLNYDVLDFKHMNFSLLNKHNDSRHFKHALGVGTGASTGYGLSYRYFPAKFGVQGNLGLYSDNDYTFANIGATFLYSLHTTSYSNFYVYQANSYNHQRYMTFDEPLFELIPNRTNIGFGLGIELLAADHFSINYMFGYEIQGKFETVKPGLQFALFYKFN